MAEPGGTKKNLPPYVSFRTLTNFLDSLKQGLPQRIDRSLMPSMAGGLQSHLMAALEYLELTEGGATTDILRRLVDADGARRKQIWKEILTKRYNFLDESGCDLSRATVKQLQDCFDKVGASGSTMRKSYSFFVAAAKDAGLQLSPYIMKPTKGSRSSAPPKARRKSSQTHQEQTAEEPEVPNDNSTQKRELPGKSSDSRFSKEDRFLLEMMMSKFPEFDPTWPDEVKQKWFEGFRDLMAELKKK